MTLPMCFAGQGPSGPNKSILLPNKPGTMHSARTQGETQSTNNRNQQIKQILPNNKHLALLGSLPENKKKKNVRPRHSTSSLPTLRRRWSQSPYCAAALWYLCDSSKVDASVDVLCSLVGFFLKIVQLASVCGLVGVLSRFDIIQCLSC